MNLSGTKVISPFSTDSIAGSASGTIRTNHCLETIGSIVEQQELTTLVKGATINCNKFSINFIQSNNKTGQIGELVHNTLPAAFAAALSMALQTQLSVLPCTEEQIYNLIQAREIEKEKELGSEEAAENENKKEFGE